MDSHAWFVIAKLVHVLTGAFWFGAAAMTAVWLLPAVRDSGPGGGAVMRQITAVRRFPVVLQVVILLALASGAYLYWRVSGGFQPNWMLSRSGLTFGVGGVLGLVAGAIGFVVTAPAAAALGTLGATVQRQDGPPTAEQAGELRRLQIVMLRAAQWIAALLLAAVAAMSVGRYL